MPDLASSALFFDFDGTLVDIAERPDAVRIDPSVEAHLLELVQRTGGAVALVSGRRLSDLEAVFPRFDGALMGCHGGEWRVDGQSGTAEEASSDEFASLRDMVQTWADHHDRVLLEEKPSSLVLHYRTAPEMQAPCTNILSTLADETPGYAVRYSKMAVELMPERISKHDSVLSLMRQWEGRVPYAIGDDRPDEGMFAAVQELGGTGIKVGDEETCAYRRVRGVADVHEMLNCWLTQPAGASCRVA